MGLDRRAFLGLVAGGAVGALCTPMPWKLIDDVAIWTQNWPWLPKLPTGQIDYVATSSKLCPAGEGLRIMRVAGNPISAAGNPAHPLSSGGVSALARSEVYMLYSPARIKSPMRRVNGQFTPITWEQAMDALAKGLGQAKGSVACVSGDATGTVNEVLSAFVGKLGSAGYFVMPSDATSAAKAMKRMGGEGQLGYDFENADVVVALGADIFETWGTATRNSKAFAASRPVGTKPKSTYIFAGPVRNNTAAVCDQWIPAAASDLGIVALGIAWHLLKNGATSQAPGFEAFKSLVLGSYGPEDVRLATGIPAATLAAVAKTLASAKAPLVVAGSPFGQGMGAGPVIAGMAVNLLLGRINRPGGIYALPELAAAVAGSLGRAAMLDADFPQYLSAVAAGKTPAPKALLVYDANPAYGLPETAAMARALSMIPFKVGFASFWDETASLCDLILPNSLPLERYDDVVTPYGSGCCLYSLVKPLQKPIHDTRTTADVLLTLAKKMQIPLGFDTFEQVLRSKVATLSKAGGFVAAKGAMPWQMATGAHTPVLVGDLWKALAAGNAWALIGQVSQTTMGFAPDILAKAVVPLARPDEAKTVWLVPYAQLRTGTPTTGVPCQDLTAVPETELAGQVACVRLNAATAASLGLHDGDMVTLSGADSRCRGKVQLFESIMNGAIAVPLGFGHTAFDRFSQDKGDNFLSLMPLTAEPGTGLATWLVSEVTIA